MNTNKYFHSDKPQLAVLIDPDNQPAQHAAELAYDAEKFGADVILVGGSLIGSDIEHTVSAIKSATRLPAIIFPGDASHVCPSADAILLLSLLSGRNPEYLIGNHVIAAPRIKNLGLDTVSCGYILIESGRPTSVEYMSNTRPIPADKHDLAVATALAGEMIGNKCIYLEGGSGAQSKINHQLIKKVRANISIPLIVGGGITNTEAMLQAFTAGADVVVVGTAIEQDPERIKEFCIAKETYKAQVCHKA